MKKLILSLIVLGVILCPVFCLASTPVELIKKINANDAGAGTVQADARYGASVAMNKDTMVICAPNEKFSATESAGAVYLYLKDKGGTGKWGYLKKITYSDVGESLSSMKLGYAVSLSNDYLVITAPLKDCIGKSKAGSAYVFGRNKGGINNWGFVQKITPRSVEDTGLFGVSVAVCDEVMVIGHPYSFYSGTPDQGRAEVYLPDPDYPGEWKYHQTLTAQNEQGALDRQYDLEFSSSLAICEGNIIAGAPNKNSDRKVKSGCVYMYSRKVDEYWRIENRIFAQNDDGSRDVIEDSQFGCSLSASGDMLLVGASGVSVGAKDEVGAAYVYSKDKNGKDQWGIVKKLEPVLSDGSSYIYADSLFGKGVSLSGDLALVGSNRGAFLFDKGTSDICPWRMVARISDSETESGALLDGGVGIHGNYCAVGASTEKNKPIAAYLFKILAISCADKTVSPTATQPPGTSVTVTSVAKRVKTTTELKKEHQTPGMDSMLGANVYEFNATVTAGKVAYFCFNSSSLGERGAEDVSLFKLFPDKESKSFTYSPGKNPEDEGYFWITDENNSGQYIDSKMVLEGARTYTVNYSVKDNGDYDLDDTPGVINDPVVPGTSSGGGSSGCVMNPQAGFAVELCGLFIVALLGIVAREIGKKRALKNTALSLVCLGLILCPVFSVASPSVELLKKINSNSAREAGAEYGVTTAMNKDTLAVGASGEGSGAVYLFMKNKGGAEKWGYLKKIIHSDVGEPLSSMKLGYAIALSNDYLVITAPSITCNGVAKAGSAYVFGRNRGGIDNWGFIQKLTPRSLEHNSEFGLSVAICDEVMVIGHPYSDYSGIMSQGRAEVYLPDPDNLDQWKYHQTLVAQSEQGSLDRQMGLSFSFSLAIVEGKIVAGAPARNSGGVLCSGLVYIYSKNTEVDDYWRIEKRISAQKVDGSSDVMKNSRFGDSLSASGDMLLVGASGVSVGSNANVGAAYVYSKDKKGKDQWGIVKKLEPISDDGVPYIFSENFFGRNVSLSGDLALIGSKSSAFLFSKSQSDAGSWGIVRMISDGKTEPGAQLDGGVAIHGNYCVAGASLKDIEIINAQYEVVGYKKSRAAYIFKTSNIVSPDSCADKTVSPTATQPTGTRAIVTSVAKRVKTTAEIKKEHQTPGMDSMLGANEYEFTASVTAGKVAYFCFNSSSLGERKAEEVALFKLFPNKDSKSFTYS
ncbi:hypothetical protein D0S45_13190, partial [Marinifilum sp. JC120]